MLTSEDRKLYEMKAEVIAAIGHPIRLAIVEFLREGEQCVCDIAEHVAAERSNVSRHLSVLARAGLVRQRKDGLRMMYALQYPCVLEFAGCIGRVLRQRMEETVATLQAL